MMQLKEFVSQTLKEIIDGVQEAQKYASSVGAKVNPIARIPEGMKEKMKTHYWSDERGSGTVEQIEFDVAVTSVDTTETQAGVGVFVAAFGLGAKNVSDSSNSLVSRIKFSVPIAHPLQE
jgi:hypothetical protein